MPNCGRAVLPCPTRPIPVPEFDQVAIVDNKRLGSTHWRLRPKCRHSATTGGSQRLPARCQAPPSPAPGAAARQAPTADQPARPGTGDAAPSARAGTGRWSDRRSVPAPPSQWRLSLVVRRVAQIGRTRPGRRPPSCGCPCQTQNKNSRPPHISSLSPRACVLDQIRYQAHSSPHGTKCKPKGSPGKVTPPRYAYFGIEFAGFYRANGSSNDPIRAATSSQLARLGAGGSNLNLGNEAPTMSKTITAILGTGILTAPLLCALVGLAIGFAFGRSRSHTLSFQNRGEARLSREIRRHFTAPNYHLMNHITLQVQGGTTQVDHILVSRFGVFVIETKDYKGWIFANGKHARWTQVLFKRKFQFQNPISQNYRHVRAVQELLDFLPADCIMSVVVFTGDSQFKTAVPPGVFSLSGGVDHIHQQTAEIMSLNRMQFCIGRLEAARLAITNETDVEHIENLKRKHGMTV